MTFRLISPLIGVDLNNSMPVAVVPTNSSGGAMTQHKLGSKALGDSDSEWQFVQANGAISAGDLVAINTTGTATRCTPTLAATGSELGFAQNAFADTDFGWICMKGNPLTVAVSSTSTLQAALWVGGVSGHIGAAGVSSSAPLAGIALLTASTTAVVGTYLAVVTFPRCTSAGN